MQTNADRSKEYVAVEKEYVAAEKEIQKHPQQHRVDREEVRRRREEDPEAVAPKVRLPTPAAEQRSLLQAPAPRAQRTTRHALNHDGLVVEPLRANVVLIKTPATAPA